MPEPNVKPMPRRTDAGEPPAQQLFPGDVSQTFYAPPEPPAPTALVPTGPSSGPTVVQAAQTAGLQLSPEKIELLKNTVAQGVTDDELELFVHICNRTGLDPFARQIYAIKRRQKIRGDWQEVMTIQTGIDGYRLIADRTGRYAPGRETTFEHDAGAGSQGGLVSATAYVKKLVAGQWHEYAATAYWAEYVQKDRSGAVQGLWKTMPHNQLAKCAEALALRRGFPAELSGVYTKEEMDQASNPGVGAPLVGGTPKARPSSSARRGEARPPQQRQGSQQRGQQPTQGGGQGGRQGAPAEPAEVSQQAILGFFQKCGLTPDLRMERAAIMRAVLGRAVTRPADLEAYERVTIYKGLRFVRAELMKQATERLGGGVDVAGMLLDLARYVDPIQPGALKSKAAVRWRVNSFLDVYTGVS